MLRLVKSDGRGLPSLAARQTEMDREGERLRQEVLAEHPGVMVTAGRLLAFRQGWAKAGLVGKCAHYFIRQDAGLIVSKCGAAIAGAAIVFRPGNFKRCQNCVRHFRRRSGRGYIYEAPK